MLCSNCGTKIPDGSRFCPKCGASVTSAARPPRRVAPGAARVAQPAQPASPQAATPVASPVPSGPEAGPQVTRRAFVFGGVAAAAVVALGVGLYTSGTLCKVFGVSVRDSVEDYSWAELSAIADQIASAASDGEGIAIASKYHLCSDDGTLDGTQLKSFQLAHASQAQAQVIGFRHDDRADGSGKAGITFVTRDCVAERGMNASGSNSSGWEWSEMRSWLNSDLLKEFPRELSSRILPVSKMSNNAGQTQSASSVTVTQDSLWLPSLVELAGQEAIAAGIDAAYASVYNVEGSQYQLFADQGVQLDGSNGCLVKQRGTAAASWWERSADPCGTNSFKRVYLDGRPHDACPTDSSCGVAPAFCL